MGGKFLLIDEVHKYPRWSVELKNIYDGFPEMKVIFTAASAPDVYRGEADLSRQIISYILPGMSYREYLTFTMKTSFEAVSFNELCNDHQVISRVINEQLRPLPHFAKYLRTGYLPIISEGDDTYQMKLSQTINTMLDSDPAYISSNNQGTSVKVKKLLGVIAESVPFKPNIAALARELDLSRESIYQCIHQLEAARLIITLRGAGKGASTLQKPEKIFLKNPNLTYALSPNPEKRNIRETFALNQLINAGLNMTVPDEGDFLTSGTIIEVEGKPKRDKQVRHADDDLLAADDIETGFGKKIHYGCSAFCIKMIKIPANFVD